MWSWIGIGVAYVISIGFFRFLGGIASAGDAIANWGRANAERRRRRGTLPRV